MDPLHRSLLTGLNMVERAMPRPTEPARKECTCGECGAIFALPALGICPKCSSRQVRRANPREEMSAGLAETLDGIAETLYGYADTFEEKGYPVTAEELREVARRAVRAVSKYEAGIPLGTKASR